MRILFDPAKRAKTLAERGLDFADAPQVFATAIAEAPDIRMDYAEPRIITAGFIAGRFVVMVWTPRGADRRIISLRHGHADEAADYRNALDRP